MGREVGEPLATLGAPASWARGLWRKARQFPRRAGVVNAAVVVASQYAAATFGLVTALVAARLLGPTTFGTAALIMAYPTLVWSLTGVKSVSVTTRFIAGFLASDRDEEVRSVCKLGYAVDLITAGAALLVVWATAGWLARAYAIPSTAWLAPVYGASFLFLSLSGTSLAILSALGQFRWLAGVQVLGAAVALVAVVIPLLLGWGLEGMVLGSALGRAAAGLGMLAAATGLLGRAGVSGWWRASWQGMRTQWRMVGSLFGWNYAFVSLTGLIGQIPVMLLGRFRGPEDAGFYRLASGISTVGTYLESGLDRVVYPTLTLRWDAGQRAALREVLRRWTVTAGLPAAAIVLGVLLLLPAIIRILFGDAYLPMVAGTRVLLAGVAAGAALFWLTSFYYVSGRLGIWTTGYGAYVVAATALALLLADRGGFVGVAWLVAAGRILFIVGMAWQAWRILRRAG